jgi:eukaryotic-like serine/threonine-protein kinase
MPEMELTAAWQLRRLWQQGRQPALADFLSTTEPLAPLQLAAVLRVDQQERWRIGQRLPAEHYLNTYFVVAEDDDASLDVIYAEFCLRQDHGEVVTPDEFRQRFPRFANQLQCHIDFRKAGSWLVDGILQAMNGGCREAAEDNTTLGPPSETAGPLCSAIHQTTTNTPLRLGKFTLLERVGLGAFGTVWRAWDTELDRVVALKIPHAGSSFAPENLQLVYQEARTSARLRHPGIVSVHEVAVLGRLPVIVSDFIECALLSQLLEERRLTFLETAMLVAGLAEILDYIHGQGIVHRDMKPANVVIERGSSANDLGRPVILDFGLAARELTAFPSAPDGQIIGTPPT